MSEENYLEDALVISCLACGTCSEIEQHHIIPQFMNSKNLKTIPLCFKHHSMIHNFLNKVIWDNKHLTQEELEIKLEEFTRWWCKLEWEKNAPQTREYYRVHCKLCRAATNFVWTDYDSKQGLIRLCERCYRSINGPEGIIRCKNCNRLYGNEISNFPAKLQPHFTKLNCLCPWCLSEIKKETKKDDTSKTTS